MFSAVYSKRSNSLLTAVLRRQISSPNCDKSTIYLTTIPRARVGYEVIDSQRGAKRRVGYNHLISNEREWNTCFIKNHQQILLDFAHFAWLEQPEGNLMDAISRVLYNGSYTIAAKPIKTLELHYTMIQFLISVPSDK